MNYQEALELKPGAVLYSSWGYDQTNIDFCVVLENTGKTLKCAMVKEEIEKITGDMSENVLPSKEHRNNEPFRLRISRGKNEPERAYLVGSYPYCNGQSAKRFGYFGIFDGQSKNQSHYH